jgi:hypothetical protein
MPNFPIEHSARVNAFLEKAAAQRPRGRLIFALDATHSRQPTWDTAARLQAEMFHEAGRIGQLSVQLVFYRGLDQCSHSAWTHDAQGLARAMSKISCQAGRPKLEKFWLMFGTSISASRSLGSYSSATRSRSRRRRSMRQPPVCRR